MSVVLVGLISFFNTTDLLIQAESGPAQEESSRTAGVAAENSDSVSPLASILGVNLPDDADPSGRGHIANGVVRVETSLAGEKAIIIDLPLHPILRNYEAVALQICIWGSAPLGILLAEAIRRRPARTNVDLRDAPVVVPTAAG